MGQLFNIFKGYVVGLIRCLGREPEFLVELRGVLDSVVWDKKIRTIRLDSTQLDWTKRVELRKKLIEVLRRHRPRPSVQIDKVVTGYYDQCLERYLFQMLNRLAKNEETCWVDRANRFRCVGRRNPVDSDAPDDFLPLQLDQSGYLFEELSPSQQEDKILDMYRNFSRELMDKFLDGSDPIILRCYAENGRFEVLSGGRRIALLRYLRTQHKIENVNIPCHLVESPLANFAGRRPFDSRCKACDWGEIYDPGTGTHQDFFIREGIAHMRGPLDSKGGRQKWAKIEPIFHEMVSGRKMIDVGAYRGLFCLKALEYGATSATAFELSEELIAIPTAIKKKYAFDELHLCQGDFFDKDDFEILTKGDYDTAIFFGIIHHLLRIGIEKNILHSFDELMERIAQMVRHGVIIEFAMPKVHSLLSEKLAPYGGRFEEREFAEALQKHFPNSRNLGRCNYNPGNPYGRFMYYATK